MEIERMSTPQDEGKSNASAPLNPLSGDAFAAVVTYAQGIISSAKLNQEAIQKLLDATKQEMEIQKASNNALSQKIEAQLHAQENAFEQRVKDIDEATKALTHCASNGARIGVNDAILSVKEQALVAFKLGVSPDLSELKRVTQEIDGAREKLRIASKYLTWKAVGIYALVALVPLLALLAWDREIVQKIETDQARLKDLSEIAEKTKFTHCGDNQRLCVQVDLKAGAFGAKKDYLVIKGY